MTRGKSIRRRSIYLIVCKSILTLRNGKRKKQKKCNTASPVHVDLLIEKQIIDIEMIRYIFERTLRK